MKLKDLLAKADTYHLKVRVLDKDDKTTDFMYDTFDVIGLGVDDMEVINVSCENEVGEASPITHTINIRPLLVVMVRSD